MATDNDGFVHAMPPKEGSDIGLRVSITQGSRLSELGHFAPLHLNGFEPALSLLSPLQHLGGGFSGGGGRGSSNRA
jgi:hypothetical protein